MYGAEEKALRVMLEGEQEEERQRDLEERQRKERERQLQKKREVDVMLFGGKRDGSTATSHSMLRTYCMLYVLELKNNTWHRVASSQLSLLCTGEWVNLAIVSAWHCTDSDIYVFFLFF